MGRVQNIRNREKITDRRILLLINECVENCKVMGFAIPKNIRFLQCKAIRRAGLACYRDNTIVLSTFIYKESDDAVRTIIYHEIGHLIAGSLAKHGPVWQKVVAKMSKATSLTITRCYSDADMPIHAEEKKKAWKYNFRCKGCGCELHYTRRTEFVNTYNEMLGNKPRWTCTKCGHGFEMVK